MRQLKSLEQQDFTKSDVPRGSRVNAWLLSATLAGFTMSSTQFLVGGTLGNGFGLNTSLLVAFIGCSILALYASLLGHIAVRTGYSFALLLASPFGTVARRIPVVLFAFLETGWLAVALGITGRAFHLILGFPEWAWIIIFTLLFTTTAFLGIRYMSRLSLLAVPLMTALIVVAAIHSFTGVGGAMDPFVFFPENPLPWYVGLNLAVGSFILSTTTSPDILRFARSTRDVVIAAVAGFLFGSFLFLVSGAIAATAYGNWDTAQNLVTTGLAVPGIVMILANTWTSYDTGLYTAAVEMGVITRYSRIGWTIALALVSCLVALGGIYYMIVEWLTLLSIVIPPIGGIILADYFFLRPKHPLKTFNLAGLSAWGIACAISLILNWHGYLMGIGGTVVGFVIYLMVARTVRQR